ncbi:MAG: hypothetical protein ACLGH0_08070 [Thermoanaerobaculia bacterium]
MKRTVVSGTLLLVFALPVFAADYEQVMLPIAPSVVHCAYESRYETRLMAYNGDEVALGRLCTEGRCRDVNPNTGTEISGDFAGGLPLPAFVYVPKEIAAGMRMSLVVESSERSRLDERAYTELPIVRASDFREGKMQLIGVRMDPEFRQTIRMYGLDGTQSSNVMMRVFSLETGEKVHECIHYIGPLTSETTAEGLQLRPAFGMECDMSEHVPAYGQKVRIELESMTPGLKYWAFMSITNNKTQHFYTVLPH